MIPRLLCSTRNWHRGRWRLFRFSGLSLPLPFALPLRPLLRKQRRLRPLVPFLRFLPVGSSSRFLGGGLSFFPPPAPSPTVPIAPPASDSRAEPGFWDPAAIGARCNADDLAGGVDRTLGPAAAARWKSASASHPPRSSSSGDAPRVSPSLREPPSSPQSSRPAAAIPPGASVSENCAICQFPLSTARGF